MNITIIISIVSIIISLSNVFIFHKERRQIKKANSLVDELAKKNQSSVLVDGEVFVKSASSTNKSCKRL